MLTMKEVWQACWASDISDRMRGMLGEVAGF